MGQPGGPGMTGAPLQAGRLVLKSLAHRARLALATAQDLPSPCVSVCRMNPQDGLCGGCWRTLDEIALWGGMDDSHKRAVWAKLPQRAGSARP